MTNMLIHSAADRLQPVRKSSLHATNIFLLMCVFVVIVSGCASPQRLKAASAVPDLPQLWSATSSNAQAPVTSAWLDDFDAPGLDTLVAEALQANFDLKVIAARVTAAQARAELAGATRRPTVNLKFDAARSRRSTATTTSYANAFGLDANIAWEIDLWNRLGNEANAAVTDANAIEADYMAARLLLVANVVKSWSNVVEARAQTHLSKRTVSSFKQVRAAIEERYRVGLTTALDVRLARENVASAESLLLQRQRETDALERTLEILLGRYPAAELAKNIALPKVTKSIPAGLPAEILLRRPDLLAAELRLSAADDRLTAAKKNRLPGIRLTGSAGTSSAELKNLLNWDQLVWNILAGITQPIFSAGQLSAEQTLAEVGHQEAWATYAQAVLVAFREVETTLSAEFYYLGQEAALVVAAEESKAAAQLAFDRYAQGLTDIVTLLDAQRRAFNAESNSLRIARQRLNNRVDIYLALGGDFKTNESKEKVAP